MISTPSRMAAIFVDRSCTEHWIVRDPEGNFWIVPSVANAWNAVGLSNPPKQPNSKPSPDTTAPCWAYLSKCLCALGTTRQTNDRKLLAQGCVTFVAGSTCDGCGSVCF